MNLNQEKVIKILDVLNGKEDIGYGAISKRTGIKRARLEQLRGGRMKTVHDHEVEALEREYFWLLENDPDLDQEIKNEIKVLRKDLLREKEDNEWKQQITETLEIILDHLEKLHQNKLIS